MANMMTRAAVQDMPIVCDLTAIPEKGRQEHVESAPELFRTALGIRQIADGVEVELGTDEQTLMNAARYIANDRLCCPFFTFTLTVLPGNERVLMRVTGPEGVKELLVVELVEKMGLVVA